MKRLTRILTVTFVVVMILMLVALYTFPNAFQF